MKAQIITIGDEILIGQTLNTNAAFIGNLLLENQVEVVRTTVVGDEEEIILQEFGEAFKLIAIYTTKELRYQRLKSRPIRPLTSGEAKSRDLSELENLDKGGPIAYADYMFLNDGTLAELKKELERVV